MRRRISRSLSAQLLGSGLLSLLVAAATFFLCSLAGNFILDHTVYGNPFIDKMADRRFERLQAYVEQEGITASSLNQIHAWFTRGDQLYLTIYIDGIIRFESSNTADLELDASEYDISLESPDREYALVLADGTVTRAFLYYYAGGAYHYWAVVLSGLIAFVTFSICFIAFVHGKMQYVKRLKMELDILAGGDLQYPVTVRGEDELGELAAGIDQMRRSILAHQSAEEKMRSANSQLVTAMSHDLRTPLTSLLAYLELVDRGKYDGEEQLRHFIHRSLEKTLQIKSMADKLFEYFLVYSSEWEQPDLEPVNADGLFQQFWGEYAFCLENEGFSPVCEFKELDGMVEANMDLLRRAFDNLYANLLKYADPKQPIHMSCRREKGQVRLVISNAVSPQRSKQESTDIGLNTCQRILQCHRGTFATQETDGVFQADITLPLIEPGS